MISQSLGHDLISTSICEFLEKNLNSNQFFVQQLAGDASARRYFRVILNQHTYVLMWWEPFVADTYPFLSVLRHFQKSNVTVPEVIALAPELGVILLEDLGDLTLERKFWESSQQEASWPFYQKALDEIIKIHTTATKLNSQTTAKDIQFDTAKFLWEMNYAKEHLIEGVLKVQLTENQKTDLQKIFTDFCEKLHHEPKVICHRDYHSRNLMLKLNKMYVIDFQDARMGPIQYDLVSLIKDSYVDISDKYAEQMLNYYFDHTTFLQDQNKSHDQFFYMYELQSVQRCFKACGSFASFMNMRQDRRYLKYLTPTLKKVMRSLAHFPEYKLLLNILIDAGAFEKNYEQM
jgi:aminoglycoside/choline kinase family phosphotransferase